LGFEQSALQMTLLSKSERDMAQEKWFLTDFKNNRRFSAQTQHYGNS